MIINATQALACLLPDMAPIAVRKPSGELAFMADYNRALDLCIAKQVCGNSRGMHGLRYLELIVPLEKLSRPEPVERSRGGMIGEDSRTTNRIGSEVSHDFPVCATFGALRHVSRLKSEELRRYPTSYIRLAYAECADPA